MAGTIVAGTLSDGTYSGSVTDTVRGACKAWVNFNGTGTVAIRAAYNVSSITDNGAGDYTVNFTNAIQDANYAPFALAQRPLNNNSVFSQVFGDANYIPTTSSVRFRFVDQANGNQDVLLGSVSIFR